MATTKMQGWKEAEIEIEGISPLLMNKPNLEDLEPKTRKGMGNSYGTKEEQAEKTAYFTSSGKKELCIPANVMFSLIMTTASGMRVKGKSIKSLIAGTIQISPEEIGLGTARFLIDSRGVVIAQGMKRNRVIRHRATLPEWKAKFSIFYDPIYIEPSILKDILETGGIKVGICDFRPQRGGQFGRFKVTQFKFK